jgi:anaerobic magnesium-protoporphyrin IX monomethyl ester cyclase
VNYQNTQTNNEFDVVLAYPAERNNFFDQMLPLGLASIAAVAEQHDYRVKILDFQFYKDDFQRDLLRWNPKIIGIGGTTPTRKESFRIASAAKNTLPEVPIVYGGVHATFTAEDTLRHVSSIDYVVQGEGEYTFLSLCHKFVRNTNLDLTTLSGLAFRRDGTIISNAPKRIDDLDALPMPARHLFDNHYKMTVDFLGLEADFLMTSRGCPVMCTFCSASRMFPGGVRLRSMKLVQEKLEYVLSKKPIRALKIFDSTFTANREHVLEFCAMIKPYNLLWECEVRADTVDRELLATMKETGCFYVDIGMETSNERLLKSIAKKITVLQVENVLRWCRELGIRTKLFFIYGHLGETYEECKNDMAYVKKHRKKIDVFANSVGLRVYPGTSLEKRMKSMGMLPGGFSWAQFAVPRKNLLLMEMGDVLILEQQHLSIIRLLVIALRLDLQFTNLSLEYVRRFFVNLVKTLYRPIVQPLNRMRQAVVRSFSTT